MQYGKNMLILVKPWREIQPWLQTALEESNELRRVDFLKFEWNYTKKWESYELLKVKITTAIGSFTWQNQ